MFHIKYILELSRLYNNVRLNNFILSVDLFKILLSIECNLNSVQEVSCCCNLL